VQVQKGSTPRLLSRMQDLLVRVYRVQRVYAVPPGVTASHSAPLARRPGMTCQNEGSKPKHVASEFADVHSY
jgi:hypothetical protein